MRKMICLVALIVIFIPNIVWSEEKEAELYHTPAEMALAGEWTMISDRVAFSGLAEVEIYQEDVDGERSSDLMLATAQLGFKGLVNEDVTVLLVADYDDEENLFTVDEATIDYEREVWYMRLGIQDVPFGYYPSHFISGPLTEDLGETGETSVMAGLAPKGIDISLWAANGEADKTGDEDRINDYGLSIVAAPYERLEFGASYIGDMADTDAELLGPAYTRTVPGVSAFIVLGAGDMEFSGEYLSATKKFAVADLDGDGDGVGDRPSAFNAEVAWELKDDMEVAVRFGGSSEFTDEPESQYGLCFSYGVWVNVSLSFEYLREKFDSDFSGDEERDAVTTQLAVEF